MKRDTHAVEGKCSLNGGTLRRSVFCRRYHRSRDRSSSTRGTACFFGSATTICRQVFWLRLHSQNSPAVPPVASAALYQPVGGYSDLGYTVNTAAPLSPTPSLKRPPAPQTDTGSLIPRCHRTRLHAESSKFSPCWPWPGTKKRFNLS